MSKHSKKGKKAKQKKHAGKKAAPLAKTRARFRKEVGVTEDHHGNILVAARAHRVGRHSAHEAEAPTGAWNDYITGGKNQDGIIIDDVLVRDEKYVVYLQGTRVISEGAPETLRRLDEIAPQIARITALLPSNPVVVHAINCEMARAYDLCMSGWPDRSKAVLDQLLAELESSHVAMARLHYVWAGIAASAACWLLIYLCYANGLITPDRLLWFQALGVGGTGGFFAVALSQRTIPIDLSHSTFVHWTSGVARILIAMAAALVVLLAIKGGVFMSVADGPGNGYLELFFCFLAGFSETFVQKLLRDNEKPDTSSAPGALKPPAASYPKNPLLK